MYFYPYPAFSFFSLNLLSLRPFPYGGKIKHNLKCLKLLNKIAKSGEIHGSSSQFFANTTPKNAEKMPGFCMEEAYTNI